MDPNDSTPDEHIASNQKASEKHMRPLCKKLKKIDLNYSNRRYASAIKLHVEKNQESPNLFKQCVYPSDGVLAKFSSVIYDIYEKKLQPNQVELHWVFLTTAENSNDNYFGAAYWNPDNQQVVIVHKGTDLTNSNFWKDLIADYQGILSNKYTSQMSSAATFTNEVAIELDELNEMHSANLTLSITGHSLGGFLAQVTAFTTQYLTIETKDGEEIFVQSDKGYQTHTVVFDSPGCKEILLKIERDYFDRYDYVVNKSFLLDITIYLSAPNLVNTHYIHLNVYNFYQVFIEDLPVRWSRLFDLVQYTLKTHKMESIKNVFFPVKNTSSKTIMRVIDWPLVEKGLEARLMEPIKELFSSLYGTLYGVNPGCNQNEYETFHKFVNSSLLGEKNRTVRYRVKEAQKEICSANVFKQSEFDFLSGYQTVKYLLNQCHELPSLASLEKKTKGIMTKNQVEEILQDVEMIEGEGRGIVKCSSEKILQKLIMYVKNILYLFPDIHTEIKNKIKDFNLNTYVKLSELYLKPMEFVELKEASMKHLSDFLNSNFQFLQLSFEMHPMIGVKKIQKSLKGCTNENQMTHLFLSLKKLLDSEKLFSLYDFFKKLSIQISVLFVIECNCEPSKAKSFFENLVNALTDKPKIKIILVTPEIYSLNQILGNNNCLYSEKKDDSKFKFDDLESSSQTYILDKNIYFQGKEISLGTLIIDNESKNLIDEDTVLQLVQNDVTGEEKMVEVGEALPKLGDVENYYIYQSFNCVKINKNFMIKKRFLITDSSEVDKSTLKADQDIIVISDFGHHFEKLCSEYQQHNIHWLKLKNNQFLWQKSYGILSYLRKFADTINVSECQVDGSVLILSSVSGAGKSTFFTKVAHKIKESDPSLWVVRVNFNSFSEKIKSQKYVINGNKIIQILLELVNLKTPLERELFKHRLNCLGKVAFLLDGYDEVELEYRSEADKLLKFLRNSKIDKLWVTTRPNLKKTLEENLSTLSFTLKTLSKKDQLMFLKKFWSKALDEEKFNEEKFNIYANGLLNCVSRPIFNKSRELTGIPLQTRMLAEAFQEEFQKYCNDLYQDEPNLPDDLELLDLYNFYVRKRYELQFTRRNVTNLKKQEYEVLYDFYMRKYSLLALCALFCEKELNLFLCTYYTEKIKKYKEEILEGEENLGFISHIVNGKPIFTHPSFTEYFAALFFSQETSTENQKLKSFLSAQLYKKEYELTCRFFDSMVLEDKDESELHFAVLNNDKNKVELLLSSTDEMEGVINCKDRLGRTALHLSATYGNLKITKILLEYNFDIHVRDTFLCQRPLWYADKCSHWEVAEKLLQKGANADDLCESKESIKSYATPGRTLVHLAAEKGLVKFLKALIENEENLISAVDECGVTPLHLASEKAIAELLINKAINKKNYISLKDENGMTALHLAASNGHEEVAEFLIENASDTDENDVTAKNNYINLLDYCENTPLHLAAIEGHEKVSSLLIEHATHKNEYVSLKDKDKRSPLHFAAHYGNVEVIKLLINYANDKNDYLKLKDSLGMSPLHLAAVKGHKEAAKILIENSTDKNDYVNLKDDEKKTPLHYASNQEIAELLIKHSSDKINYINLKDMFLSTPLHSAVIQRYRDVAEYLIAQVADFEVIDEYCRTPLLFTENKEIAELLKKHATDKNLNFGPEKDIKNFYVNQKDSHGKTPLHHVSRKEFAELLIEHAIDKDAYVRLADKLKNTPLHYAAMQSLPWHNKPGKALKACMELAELLMKYVKNKSDYVNLKNNEQETSLHLAAYNNNNNNHELVEFLLAKGAKVEVIDCAGRTPLHLTRGKKIAELLVHHAADKNSFINSKDKRQRTPLHFAAENGRKEIVKILTGCAFDKSMYVNLKDIEGQTPLHLAVKYVDIAQFLIECSINKTDYVNIKDIDQNTPLHNAAACPCGENVVQILIKEGADVECVDGTRCTPLHCASNQKIAELLIAKAAIENAYVNLRDNQQWTPLHYAAQFSDWNHVQLLIKKGADVECVDENHRTPLHLAAKQTGLLFHLLIKNAELLIENVADKKAYVNLKDTKQFTPLHYAAQTGHEEMTRFLIEQNADIRAETDMGVSPLHLAANKEIAEILLEHLENHIDKLAYVNLKDTKQLTPLHYAAKKGHKEMVQFLIAQGAVIRAESDTCVSPLHLAANKEIAEILLEHLENHIDKLAYVNLKDTKQFTPLHYAAKKGHKQMAQFLIAQGADIRAETDMGASPLHLAANKDIVEILFEHIIDVFDYINATDKNKDTPLHYAAASKYYNKELVEFLITKGADVEAKNKFGCTPLHMAIVEKNRVYVELGIIYSDYMNGHGQPFFNEYINELLIKQVTNKNNYVNLRDKRLKTALHYAVDIGDKRTAQLLIDYATDKNHYVNLKDIQRRTPLHYAAARGYKVIAELLIDYATDKNHYVNLKDIKLKTPLLIAKDEGHQELVEFLETFGSHGSMPLAKKRRLF